MPPYTTYWVVDGLGSLMDKFTVKKIEPSSLSPRTCAPADMLHQMSWPSEKVSAKCMPHMLQSSIASLSPLCSLDADFH